MPEGIRGVDSPFSSAECLLFHQVISANKKWKAMMSGSANIWFFHDLEK
jgi:hypothetical protein